MSTFPFFLSWNPASDPARLAPALTRSMLGPLPSAPPEQSSPEGLVPAKESPRDTRRIRPPWNFCKRQGASEGVWRRNVVTCRGYPPPVLQPLALGPRLSHPHQAFSREVPRRADS